MKSSNSEIHGIAMLEKSNLPVLQAVKCKIEKKRHWGKISHKTFQLDKINQSKSENKGLPTLQGPDICILALMKLREKKKNMQRRKQKYRAYLENITLKRTLEVITGIWNWLQPNKNEV